MPTDAEAKLAELLAEVERHREAAREFGLAGYATMSERHQRLLKLVCAEIRRHCRECGLAVPDSVPGDEPN